MSQLTKVLLPCLADLMAASDFTQYLLNDPHAPMVTVSLEEQALAPARALARVPYLEHLLAPVRWPPDGHLRLPSHKHMQTWPLPEALADYRRLGDPNVVLSGVACPNQLHR